MIRFRALKAVNEMNRKERKQIFNEVRKETAELELQWKDFERDFIELQESIKDQIYEMIETYDLTLEQMDHIIDTLVLPDQKFRFINSLLTSMPKDEEDLLKRLEN